MTDLFHDSDSDVGAEADSRSASSRAERRQRAKRKAQRRRTLFTFAAMVLGLAVLVVGAWILIKPLFDQPESTPELTDYPGPGAGSASVVVSPGDSGAAIGETLVEAEVVATVDAFVAVFSTNPDAAGIQPGTYTLQQHMPAADALNALLDPANRADGITIPEGWRATQIYERIAEILAVDVADVEAAAAEVTLPEEAEGAIEGWLFPSTYTPGEDATPQDVLQQMVDRTVEVLESNEIPREDWHDVIIKASIVEREVSLDEYRASVAEVIDNRLESCDGTGRLGMDSTLVYELGKPANEITQSEWDADTPYNTRVTVGLPPTAISSPGEPSIVAAANPTDGDYCYFVTVNLDTGETKFTADYDEFVQFREEYQQWLAARDEESGD